MIAVAGTKCPVAQIQGRGRKVALQSAKSWIEVRNCHREGSAAVESPAERRMSAPQQENWGKDPVDSGRKYGGGFLELEYFRGALLQSHHFLEPARAWVCG